MVIKQHRLMTVRTWAICLHRPIYVLLRCYFMSALCGYSQRYWVFNNTVVTMFLFTSVKTRIDVFNYVTKIYDSVLSVRKGLTTQCWLYCAQTQLFYERVSPSRKDVTGKSSVLISRTTNRLYTRLFSSAILHQFLCHQLLFLLDSRLQPVN